LNRLIGSWVAAGVVLAALGASGAASASEPFQLKSPDFDDNGKLAVKNAGADKINVNCVGDNISPPLQWSSAPANTKSYALVLSDPEGRAGLGIVRWVIYGIPAMVSKLAEGEGSKPSTNYVEGKGDRGLTTYNGPCTAPGITHHYVFTLIATDLDPKALKPGLDHGELMSALYGHVRGATGLIGRYGRE
jgi:Raf kinase inhibitor-like YbhB/YbcL family protein